MKMILQTMRLRLFNDLFFWIMLAGVLLSCGKKGEGKVNSSQTDTITINTSTKNEEGINSVKDKGVGPIQSIKLDEINPSLAEHGKLIYDMKCSACHKLEERYVGPSIKGVTERRSPEWIMNMILNPVEMTQKDQIAKKLLDDYRSQMTYQDVKEDEARALLEYFRMEDSKK